MKILKLLLKTIWNLFAVIAVLIIGLILVIIMILNFTPIDDEYCIDDGYCSLGKVIIFDDKEIVIHKQNCIENGWKWQERSQFCVINKNKFDFKLKEKVYE